MTSPPKLDDLFGVGIGVLRQEVRARLRDFGETTEGRIVREAGRRIIEAKKRGVDPTPAEIVKFFEDLPGIVMDAAESAEGGSSDGDSDGNGASNDDDDNVIDADFTSHG